MKTKKKYCVVIIQYTVTKHRHPFYRVFVRDIFVTVGGVGR